MRDLLILLVHLIATLARLLGPGGLRSVVAESTPGQAATADSQSPATPGAESPRIGSDRPPACVRCSCARPACSARRSCSDHRRSSIFIGCCVAASTAGCLHPGAVAPAPKGPPKVLVDAIVEMKRRNPRWGCPRIAQQIGLAFDIQIDKDVARRVLATHYRPGPGGRGPSWLTLLGQTKDSLWSIDLFRCESALLRSHWVLVVMDHYTRRIIGFGVHAGIVGWPSPVPHVQPCDSRTTQSDTP